ncbi:type I DNA topoisomerase [Microbacter margulisiae]|uniref:DNA topoisomerase 1 n=1 Tax=Microbacter margulisiae TaxID=1350067 RepID=A0A7W5DPF3_9PORP|nr:type I DNA topoisomerase [Microbacter margulisiae]MBB3186672.1 DNA topoisomerase-1 [Microbacter margulisiae]
MSKNLVIVESPAKAKTIEKFLGSEYAVLSSFGHIRDLSEHAFGVDIEHGFNPIYEISPDKKKLVSELKKASDTVDTVWLASDEDREGEAIAWHLSEVLKLKREKTRRIVFHEITKPAILQAIEHPREIDIDLVNAQQARRILDRIVGFELSPVLWRKVKSSLSAGRVQSVAVRLIVEREREIQGFVSESSYRVVALFTVMDEDENPVELKAELQHRFAKKEDAYAFLEACKASKFTIEDIVKKPSKRSPAPPFTTSTLQQEAARKLGYSVSQTMMIAQKLYEAGQITYMRTDSVNLSDLALGAAKAEIFSMAGERYWQFRRFQTRTKGAQEAHEAIRPTYLNKHEINGTAQEKNLYALIWKRTIASQMSDAELERTNITIGMNNSSEKFLATGEIIKFDGFLKVYMESTDEDSDQEAEPLLPPLKVAQLLNMSQITATERFTQRPPRYSEAALVRKLEELGIGRPSTYAPTISTIQKRNYVEKSNLEGEVRTFTVLTLKEEKIKEENKTERYGADKGKLLPTDIGMVVNDFLMDYFPNILDYNFTANVEKEFDDIAEGQLDWQEALKSFYEKFHPKVIETMANSERRSGERVLGIDPKTGKQVSVRIGRFGPIVQLGNKDDDDKLQFASLKKGQLLETITFEEALDLFKLPRSLGKWQDKELVVGIGRFGAYVRYDGAFYSLPKTEDPLSISADAAVELIEAKREADKNKLIKSFEQDADLQILNGRFGPYISYKKQNFKIPKTTNPAELTYEACLEIIQSSSKPAKKSMTKKKSTKKG